MAGTLSTCQKFGLIFGLFTLGTYNTVITKVLFTVQSVGKDGKPELFLKPAFGNWTMFLGMSLSLLAHFYSKSKQKVLVSEEPLLANASARSPRHYLLIAIPAACDLVAMGLSLVGIILIPASIWQMLRGAEIVFAALLTCSVLGRRLYAFHWLGVGFAMLGIMAVSVATLASSSDKEAAASSTSPSNSSTLVAVGIALTLGSQVITAAQIIIEEHFLTDSAMEPMLIVGVEGLWGFFFMTFIVYPLLWLCPGPDHGHAEDVVDTAYLLKNSWIVQAIAVADLVSCLVYNIVGMKVTEAMSGVMRTMLEATRTLMVWIFNLGWHYLVDPNSMFGEAWTTWSYLELFGFALLILGQATYGAKLKFPGLEYPPEEMSSAHGFMSPAAVIAGVMQSPAGRPKLSPIGESSSSPACVDIKEI